MVSALHTAGAAARTVAAPQAVTRPPAVVPRVAPSPGAGGISSDTLSAVTALSQAETSFKANAAVMRTASQMVEALYNAID